MRARHALKSGSSPLKLIIMMVIIFIESESIVMLEVSAPHPSPVLDSMTPYTIITKLYR